MGECGECKFWTEATRVDDKMPRFGLCRRRAPVPIMVGMQQPRLAGQQPQPVIVPYFPQVIAACGCGEFEAAGERVPLVDLSKLDLSGLEMEGEA